MSKTDSSERRRFAIALSFPGERREYVEQVASALLPEFGGEQGKARISPDFQTRPAPERRARRGRGGLEGYRERTHTMSGQPHSVFISYRGVGFFYAAPLMSGHRRPGRKRAR
jgi:hypothetical protein